MTPASEGAKASSHLASVTARTPRRRRTSVLLFRPVAFRSLADKKMPDTPWKDISDSVKTILTEPDLDPTVFTNPTAKARACLQKAVRVYVETGDRFAVEPMKKSSGKGIVGWIASGQAGPPGRKKRKESWMKVSRVNDLPLSFVLSNCWYHRIVSWHTSRLMARGPDGGSQ